MRIHVPVEILDYAKANKLHGDIAELDRRINKETEFKPYDRKYEIMKALEVGYGDDEVVLGIVKFYQERQAKTKEMEELAKTPTDD